jgi:formyl-CoA transferase
VTLNLKHPEGIEIAHKLVAQADIVVENFRPGVMEKLGLGWEVLSAIKSGPGHGASSGFGQTGPMAPAGFGAIGESMGGLRYITGFPDRPPVKTGISIGDSIAALWGALGALMALRHREVNGGAGQVVDVALYEAVFAMMESLVPEFDVFGFIRERTGNVMPGITPSNTHTTRRQAPDHRRQRRRHFPSPDAGHRPCDLADDPQLASNAGRDARAAEIYGVIDAWVGGQTMRRGLAHCSRGPGAGQPIFSVADMFATPSSSPGACWSRRNCLMEKTFISPGWCPSCRHAGRDPLDRSETRRAHGCRAPGPRLRTRRDSSASAWTVLSS